MTTAALAISALAIVISAVSVNYQRLLSRWALDHFSGRKPKPWHVRYRSQYTVTQTHVQLLGKVTPEMLAHFRDAIRRGLLDR